MTLGTLALIVQIGVAAVLSGAMVLACIGVARGLRWALDRP